MTTDLADTSPDLVRRLVAAGDEHGPMGVALAAAHLTDPEVLIRRLEAERWIRGTATAVCCIDGCDYDDIDIRGPVKLRDDDTDHYACVEHWEAIMAVLGRQVGSDDEHRPMEVTA